MFFNVSYHTATEKLSAIQSAPTFFNDISKTLVMETVFMSISRCVVKCSAVVSVCFEEPFLFDCTTYGSIESGLRH